jgi:hypothetical protein
MLGLRVVCRLVGARLWVVRPWDVRSHVTCSRISPLERFFTPTACTFPFAAGDGRQVATKAEMQQQGHGTILPFHEWMPIALDLRLNL